MNTLSEYLISEQVVCHLDAVTKNKAIDALSELLAKPAAFPDAKAIAAALEERERLATTGIGEGVAIPHAKLDGLDGIRIAVGISPDGCEFDSVDGKPVHIFFALIAPLGSAGDHLRILAQISRFLKDAEFRARLVKSATAEELLGLIASESGD